MIYSYFRNMIAFVAIFTSLLILTPLSVSGNTPTANQNVNQVNLSQLAESLRLQDEILTSAMTTYLFSQDEEWLERYRAAAARFDDTLSELRAQVPVAAEAYLDQIDAFNELLIELEGRAENYIMAGQQDKAREVLESPDYQQHKQSLLSAIDQLYEAVASFEQSQAVSVLTPAISSQRQLRLTDEEKAWVASNPVALVGKEVDWPPFNFTNKSGQHVGISVDVLNLITEKTGLEFDYSEPASYSQLHGMLEEREIDLILAAYFSAERSQHALHTPSYLVLKEFVFVRDGSNISSMAELNGKRMALPSGYSTIDMVKARMPDIEIVETSSLLDAIEMVLAGQADATMDSQSVIEYYLYENNLSGLKSFPSDLGQNPLRMLVAGHKPQLHSVVTKAIASITPEERLAILSKWLDSGKVMANVQALANTELSAAEREWLRAHPVVKFGADPDWAPFEFIDTQGNYSA